MTFEQEWKNKYINTTALRNPKTFQYTDKFSPGQEGDKGKVYYRRGRLHTCSILKTAPPGYIVPCIWQRPKEGFKHNFCGSWESKSELFAREYYRYSQKAQEHLKRRWNAIIEAEDKIYKLSRKKDSNFKLPKFKDGFTLRPHQKAVVEFCQTIEYNPLIALEMRMGKSYGALAYIATLKFNTCLIVVPANLILTWKNFLETIFVNPSINLLKREDSLKQGFNIISYNLVHTISAKSDVCILDEVHYIKNMSTIRSRGVFNIEAKKRLILSATPFSNSEKEVLALLQWLNPELFAEWTADNKGLFTSGVKVNAEFLERYLRRTCMMRLLTEEVVEIGEVFVNIIPLTDIDPTLGRQELGLKKVPYAIQYANSHDEKLIICTVHKRVAEQIAMSLGSKAVLRTGDSLDKNGIMKDFETNKQILVCTYSSIKIGIDLSFASKMLYVEYDYSLEMEQVKARCLSNDKKDYVVLDFLEVPGSIDSRILNALKLKTETLECLN